MAGLVRALALCLLVSLHGCGGGGGGGWVWLFPLWVQTDVLVADVDGDGRPDVITLAQVSYGMSQSEGRLMVRLQTAPGAFTAPQSYVVGIYPWKMALADIDGDGAPDLVVADVGSTSSADGRAVWMLRQDAANRGRFLAPQSLMSIGSSGTNPYDLAIGDVNGDGAPDVIVAASTASGRGATLLLQDLAHRGTFLAPALIALPGDATAVAVGDLNGDGRADLVFRMVLSQTNYVPSTALGVVYQQAGGTLAPAVSLSPQTGLNTAYLTMADYNADGVRDVVEFFTPSSTDYQAKITTMLQSLPPGSFALVDTSLAWVRGIDDGVAADLNGDGRPDFASVGFYPEGSPSYVNSSLNLFLQDGSGRFNLATNIGMPIASSRLAAADINGDGLTDLAVLGSGNRVLVLLQSAASHGTFLAPLFLN
jgi:hypothetical protein